MREFNFLGWTIPLSVQRPPGCTSVVFLFHHIANLILLSSVRARLRRVSGTPVPPPTALVARLPRTACVSHEAHWAAALSTEASWGSDARPPITDPQPLQLYHTMPRRSHSPGAAGQQTSSQSSHPSSRAGKQALHLNTIITSHYSLWNLVFSGIRMKVFIWSLVIWNIRALERNSLWKLFCQGIKSNCNFLISQFSFFLKF